MNPTPSPSPSRPSSLRRQLALGLLLLLAMGLSAAHTQTELTDLAKVRASGVLKVVVYKDNAPFVQGPANDLKGLDVALAQALAKAMNLNRDCP